jgi:SAM-dependent methyltransferase
MEIDAVRERYERRKREVAGDRYNPLKPENWQSMHERHRVMLQLFSRFGFENFQNTTLLEVGCGAGDNLLEFLRLGFQPENLKGIELLEDRVAKANKVLPQGLVRLGDAVGNADIMDGSQDIVYQSVVFSSLLDDGFQQALANKMWNWVRPGGAVLWYDFVYNNPSNPDVRGVSMKRVQTLFPEGKFTVRRVTLAPPISRRVCRIHPSFYTLFNFFPFLRTHIFCWIQKTSIDSLQTL